MEPGSPQSNPYAMPASGGFAPVDVSQPHYATIVQQILPFGILMMVNGALFVLAGLGCVAVPVLAITMADAAEFDDQETIIVIAVYATMGVIMLIGGILQLWAGWRAIQFRSIAWTIVGIVTAAMGSITCYCAPTGIGLGVWGLILLLNPDVQHAFRMGKTQKRETILQHFSYRGDSCTPPQPQMPPQPQQQQPPQPPEPPLSSNPFDI